MEVISKVHVGSNQRMVRREIKLHIKYVNIDQIYKQFNEIIKEATLEVSGKNDKQRPSKLSVETKQPKQKTQGHANIAKQGQNELAKTFNKKKREDYGN